jgi:hypothetical protein
MDFIFDSFSGVVIASLRENWINKELQKEAIIG